MKILIGSDHRGFQLKSRIVPWLQQQGHDVVDVGTNSPESVDYPDFAALVARKVGTGEGDRGILICGSGIGMAITANKFPGVRAITAYDNVAAEMSRRHNDVNVLCLSADRFGEGPVDSLLHVWLETEFEGGRHARRLEKIRDIEHELE